ncbi:MAG: hypothetical protein MK015_09520 [Alphaproteobacteria bacterium]|jgi:hypothetical protein|nr:hypothetical protein [Alphaproteobacteria bacterium]
MKPFYILLLIIGISVTLLGIYISIDSIRQYMVFQELTEELQELAQADYLLVIVVGAMTFVIGLLISLFGYGRLKTITRTD